MLSGQMTAGDLTLDFERGRRVAELKEYDSTPIASGHLTRAAFNRLLFGSPAAHRRHLERRFE